MRISRTLAVVVVLVAVSLAADPWIVRPDGIGPVKVGMSLAQLNAALSERFSMPKEKEDQGCFFVGSEGHPPSFMIEDGRVVRVDVDAPGIFTAEGIQVGDTEAQAQKVYGSRLKVGAAAYTGPEGHYLTVHAAGGRYGIRFETEDGKISTFYAGTFKAIQYIEGCQ